MMSTIGKTSESRSSALLKAAREGDVDTLISLVKQKPDVLLERDAMGNSALHLSVLHDHKSFSLALMRERAELRHVGNAVNRTPLHYAAIINCSFMEHLILVADHQLHQWPQDDNGRTALDLAKSYCEDNNIMLQLGTSALLLPSN